MQWIVTIVSVLQVLSALIMIGLVLVQHGKGADMGASFGSGASGSLFGASGSANFLSRSTAVCATVFFCCTLGLSYVGNHRGATDAAAPGVLDRGVGSAPSTAPSLTASGVPATPTAAASAKPATPASGAALIPAQ